MTGSNEARAALERGGRVVLVTPPAPEHIPGLWELTGDDGAATTLIVCADRASAIDWVAAAPAGRATHAVTGLTRSARLLAAGGVRVLAGGLDDLTQLLTRAVLKGEAITTVVIAWPEALATGPARGALDTVLSETRDARRIILTWNPPLLGEFLDRHAFRAPVIGAVPLDDAARPLPPVAPARYVLAMPDARLGAIRSALDVLDPPRTVIWTPDASHAARLAVALRSAEREAGLSVGADVSGEPGDLIVCARVPSREQFAALAGRGPVLLLLTPSQLGYARFIAAPLTAVRLPGAADRAADAAEALRRRLAARLDAGDVAPELLLLEPLFERFDPAEVAAALVALWREPGAGSREPGAPPPGPAAAFVKLFVNVGKKDRASAKDLVGALIKEVGLQKADIGRIELRDTFSTVEVAAGVAADAARKLAGVTIRGRRVHARTDRDR